MDTGLGFHGNGLAKFYPNPVFFTSNHDFGVDVSASLRAMFQKRSLLPGVILVDLILFILDHASDPGWATHHEGIFLSV